MRSPAPAARILTLVFLASHSFVLLASAQTPAPSDVDVPALPSSAPAAPSSPSAPVPSSSNPPTPSQPPSSAPSPSKSAAPTPASSASAKPASSAPVTTSQSSAPAPASSSDPTSASSAQTSSSVSTSSAPSSVSSASSVITSAPTVTPTSGTAQQGTSYRHFSSTHLVTGTATDGELSPTGAAVADSASGGLLHNKGAMAGIFTVVGLVAVGLVITAVSYFMKRRSRKRSVEDDFYFEKYQDPEPEHHGSGGADFGHLGVGGLGQSSANLATHAAVDAYPDRSIHYGANEVGYNNPQDYGMEYPPAAPAGTAYAAAANQHGHYQYGVAGVGAGGYPAYGHDQQQQYDNGQASKSPSPHPFADPSNLARHGQAPAVTSQAYDGYAT